MQGAETLSSRAETATRFRVADLTLDIGQRKLSRDTETIALSRRTFALLRTLVEHAPNLVTHETLADRVWGSGSVVTPENLSQHVALLRRALGDEASSPRYIEGVRGQGYRLIPEVRVAANPSRRGKPRAAIAALLVVIVLGAFGAGLFIPASVLDAPMFGSTNLADPDVVGRDSLVVLPFEVQSADADDRYFADGLSDELINNLAQIDGLLVLGRTTSFTLRERDLDAAEIGQTLDVDYVLEGSIRRSGERWRVTAQLLDAQTGFQVWTEAYEREHEDLLSMQMEIARAVAGSLSTSLVAGQRYSDPLLGLGAPNAEAYDAYLRGWGLLQAGGRENTLRAEQLFREAFALDPGFHLAKARLMQSLDRFAANVPERAAEAQRERDALAEELIEQVDVSWLVHGLRATQQWNRHDWAGAERSLSAAREAAPPAVIPEVNRAEAFLLQRVGRLAESLDYARAAVRADPLSLGASATLQYLLHSVGSIAEAEKEYERSLDLQGDRAAVEALAMMRAVIENFDRSIIDERRARLQAAAPLPPDAYDPLKDLGDREAVLAGLRQAFSTAQLDESLNALAIAWWADYYGDTELAVDSLRRWMDFTRGMLWGPWDPVLRNVRRTPEFEDIAREFGFVDYWRETGHWGDFCRPLGDDDFECI